MFEDDLKVSWAFYHSADFTFISQKWVDLWTSWSLYNYDSWEVKKLYLGETCNVDVLIADLTSLIK